MDLYEVSDDYIKYLKKYDKRVLDNHFIAHNRKYIGIKIILNNKNYYLPLSHPDKTDFVNGKPRKSVIPIFRIITNKGRLLGKVLINNMIPVPTSELTYYDVNQESDINYKNLVLMERRILQANKKTIINNARILYNQKISGVNYPYLNATVDFTRLESACDTYCN